MDVVHWESYYRGGALAAVPSGPEGSYTLEMRGIWADFFSRLVDGTRILDIGTGNGAIALIAHQTATSLGRSYEVHGADLALINPRRDVPDGTRLFGDIVFHPGVATENLPFPEDYFGAVSGQYSLEYTDVNKSLARVLAVLQRGGIAQFVLHHVDSVVVERARASLGQADVVMAETKVYRRLRSFLDAEPRSPSAAQRAWQELRAAIMTLQGTARAQPDRRLIEVTLDAINKLLAQRGSLSKAALAREIDCVENDLRHAVRRLKDVIGVAADEATVAELTRQALELGYIDVVHRPVNLARTALVGWQFILRKPQ